jgi:hypothetical protein
VAANGAAGTAQHAPFTQVEKYRNAIESAHNRFVNGTELRAEFTQ